MPRRVAVPRLNWRSIPNVSPTSVEGVKRMPREPIVVGKPAMPSLRVSATSMLPPQGSATVWPVVVPPLS
ncbi:hypothetical protein D3C78_1635360 [compost metagenome]